MLFGSYNEEYKQCILECNNGKHFFRIPNSPKVRKIWLDNLGFKSANLNSRVCNNHFSEQMFSKSGKRLMKTAVPDRNIPSAMNGNFELEDGASSKLEGAIDHLCRDEGVQDSTTSPESSLLNNNFRKNSTQQSNEIFPEVPAQECSGDASKLLINYQLRNQGRHVCDVIELPQFILVFTAFRAKDTFIIPPNDLMPEYMQTEDQGVEETLKSVQSLKAEKSSKRRRNLKKTEASEDKTIQPSELPAREIKYVHYTPRKNVVQRERETQVDASSVTKTTEAGVQCDANEESAATTIDESSELEWINHIIEAHVFNAEGDMYECHICGEIAASYASKLKHSLVHQESSSLCPQCGRLFSSHVKLRNHERKAHLEKKLEIKKALRCPKFHCTKAFHSRRQLFDHIDQHTKKKTEKRCNKCQRTFSSSIQLHCHKSRNNCWR